LSEADHELWKVLGCVMSEDDPAFYWEMMFKNLTRENSRLMERLVKLEDLLRWRKWPEECPEAGGKYLVIWFDDAKGLWLDDIKVVQCNEPLRECFFKLGYFYWRPIGPLPKESE
jgi:hypothetical protein